MSQSLSMVAPSGLVAGDSRIAGHHPSGSDPFAQARGLMVDGQVRPNQVNDPRIIEAMRQIRRERFVPEAARLLAYRDGEVEITSGRALTEPRVIARLVQAAGVRAGEKVLLVGAATGYVAALLACLGAEVVALESDPALAALGASLTADRDTFADRRSVEPVIWSVGPLAAGVGAGAPYDLIVIDGAVACIPSALAAQLRAGGRVVTVISPQRAGQVACASLAEEVGGGLRPVPLFDAAVRPIAELAAAPAFVF